MAKLHTPFAFTGKLRGVTAYTRKDLPGTVILRTQAGPTAGDINTRAAYDLTRRNNKEFGGRSTTARFIRRALYPLRHLEDHNVGAALTKLLKPVQALDTVSSFGRRSVCLSRQPHLLEGFNLNQRHPFEGAVRHPLAWSLSKEDLSARLEVPELLANINFLPPPPHPLFRLTVLLGVVPDQYWGEPLYGPSGDYGQLFPVVEHTEWRPVKKGAPATTLDVQLPYAPPGNDFSLLLAVGLEMGTAAGPGSVEPVRYAGSARIVEVR